MSAKVFIAGAAMGGFAIRPSEKQSRARRHDLHLLTGVRDADTSEAADTDLEITEAEIIAAIQQGLAEAVLLANQRKEPK